MLKTKDRRKIRNYCLTEKQEQLVIQAWESSNKKRFNSFIHFLFRVIDLALIIIILGSLFLNKTWLPNLESLVVFYVWLFYIVIGTSLAIFSMFYISFNKEKTNVVFSRSSMDLWSHSRGKKIYSLLLSFLLVILLAIGSYTITAIFLVLAIIIIRTSRAVIRKIVQESLDKIN